MSGNYPSSAWIADPNRERNPAWEAAIGLPPVSNLTIVGYNFLTHNSVLSRSRRTFREDTQDTQVFP